MVMQRQGDMPWHVPTMYIFKVNVGSRHGVTSEDFFNRNIPFPSHLGEGMKGRGNHQNNLQVCKKFRNFDRGCPSCEPLI